MPAKFLKTKPCFLEAGLPCSSLSAECESDNDARQRPPQNRLHIWWARRPPTVCRVAILTALLPHDERLLTESTQTLDPAVAADDLEQLSAKERLNLDFYQQLLSTIPPTDLPDAHRRLLLVLRVFGDPARFTKQRAAARTAGITLPRAFNRYLSGNRDTQVPEQLLVYLRSLWQRTFDLADGEAPILLDFMSGGGAIPLEGIRYGLRVYANDLNPVAAVVQKATLEYPARFGSALAPAIRRLAEQVAVNVRKRLERFFPFPPTSEWWPDVKAAAHQRFSSKQVVKIEPGESSEQRRNTYLWCRVFPCPACGLKIPLSTNFVLDTKGKPETHLAAFPAVPRKGQADACTFNIVRKSDWASCHWPRLTGEDWHPQMTPTFRDGKAICPRCGRVETGDVVKDFARGQEGGLSSQLYAVASQVPVRLTYRNGEVKTKYLWRFRAPTATDLEAIHKAEAEAKRLRSQWVAQDLLPSEEVPEGDKTREPKNMGMFHWRNLFLPRQLLTNVAVLDEIRKAQEALRRDCPPEQAEAVSVYLSLILSKIVNYNSVNTFWDYTRRKGTQTFSRHDFAFRGAFTEFEGAREPVMWGAAQVLGAYEELAALIHGAGIGPAANEDDDASQAEEETESDAGMCEDEAPETSSGALSSDNTTFDLRPEVIVPTVTCDDAAALSVPAPSSVHLICVDPPYYNNVQYSELSNFFYVWLKRALRDFDGLAPLFREPLAESNREAVANAARWKREEEEEQARWQARYDEAFQRLRGQGVKVKDAKAAAEEAAGTKPQTAAQRADRFYEDKMSAVFRRARQLLHPAGRMVVMFNHKQTAAWSSLGMALTRAGFEVRSSVPIHTEAESSLNIRGLDAARSTVLLMCVPREEREQPEGNWSTVQKRVNHVARAAAQRFQGQGLSGTDLYLSALGPALGEVGRNWPVTTLAGREVDLEDALEEAYKAVGAWRLEQILASLTERAKADELLRDFTAESVDKNTQTLWLWLDTFQGEVAGTDDVRRLAKSLNVEPDAFKRLGLLKVEKDTFVLQSPTSLDLRRLARQLRGEETGRGRAARAADAWEERVFPEFLGAAVWNAIGLMLGAEEGARGPESLKRWLRESGYGSERDFRGAFLVTLHLLEAAFRNRREDDEWLAATTQARRAWDLVMQNGRR